MFIRPCEGKLTSPFGYRIHPIEKIKKFHKGIDLAKAGNVPILASADGKVVRAGGLGGYGNVVILNHRINGKIYETTYAHLKSFNVRVGHMVKKGEKIGLMGNTGASAGQHLHFEIHEGIWETGQPNAVDPLMYLPLETSLKKGDKGYNVEVMQYKLKKVGFISNIDGDFGEETRKAVLSFQNTYKLQADGIYGMKTQSVLDEVLEKKDEPVKGDEKEMAEGVFFKPSSKQLEKEVIKMLEVAHKNKLFSDADWIKKAKSGQLELDDLIGLQAMIFNKK